MGFGEKSRFPAQISLSLQVFVQIAHNVEQQGAQSLFHGVPHKRSIFSLKDGPVSYPPIKEVSPTRFHVGRNRDSALPIRRVSDCPIGLNAMLGHVITESSDD